MKDEIKEILEWLEIENLTNILNYITNLQEESRELNRMCEIYSKSLYNADLTKAEKRIDKAIEKLKTLMPICIMPNNTLIHGTEKAKIIEETLNILQESDK